MERLDQSLDGVAEIRSQTNDHNDLNNSDHLSDHRNVPRDRTDNQQTSHKNSKITVTRITEIILG